MRSLDEHLDQQELQKLLGEVIHHTRASMDHPAPDHQVLAKVAISRQVLLVSLLITQEQVLQACPARRHCVGSDTAYTCKVHTAEAVLIA